MSGVDGELEARCDSVVCALSVGILKAEVVSIGWSGAPQYRSEWWSVCNGRRLAVSGMKLNDGGQSCGKGMTD